MRPKPLSNVRHQNSTLFFLTNMMAKERLQKENLRSWSKNTKDSKTNQHSICGYSFISYPHHTHEILQRMSLLRSHWDSTHAQDQQVTCSSSHWVCAQVSWWANQSSSIQENSQSKPTATHTQPKSKLAKAQIFWACVSWWWWTTSNT